MAAHLEASPPFRDSDAMQIVIKRLQLVADKMRRLEYDDELQRQMAEVSAWLDWLATSINARNESQEK